MKKLFTAVLIIIISSTGFAQEKNRKNDRQGMHEKHQMEKLSPEQRNQLMLKKMTLELDLDASQQKEISKIIAYQSAKREAHMKSKKNKTEKLTADEIFEMKSKMLDEQMELKAKMKKILTPEQFEKWDEMKKHHHKTMKRKMRMHQEHGMK